MYTHVYKLCECACLLVGNVWRLHVVWCIRTILLIVLLCRAEAKLLEETARPLIDTLGKVAY